MQKICENLKSIISPSCIFFCHETNDIYSNKKLSFGIEAADWWAYSPPSLVFFHKARRKLEIYEL